ncbi:Trp biosynthesis-associated membrane protein [Occultella aeris]|uniref:Tryptophan-associated transmembrane protein (Trp_oprn_chp) n=1 Tax=Occultella aeris TaxID=2761496 RepID=A0A7M4DQW5_9MICO|nr:Trp biosynthesis-associated membrane protein [Occultella aeris]VZO39859.1 Tryptophan-associated transmembrane protein (Trp_oprn_chp) [Occultella aeris]
MTPAFRRRRLGRGPAVLILLVAGASLLVTTLGTWVSAPVAGTLGTETVSVGGAAAAPVVPSVALVVLAAALALGLSGWVVRMLAAVLAALAGAAALVAVLAFLQDPATPAQAAAGELIGVREISGEPAVTALPYLALAVAAVILILGIALPFLVGQWGRVGRRYERGSDPAAVDAVAPGPRAPGPIATPAAGSARTARMDDWDALSRGEDPSEEADR